MKLKLFAFFLLMIFANPSWALQFGFSGMLMDMTSIGAVDASVYLCHASINIGNGNTMEGVPSGTIDSTEPLYDVKFNLKSEFYDANFSLGFCYTLNTPSVVNDYTLMTATMNITTTNTSDDPLVQQYLSNSNLKLYSTSQTCTPRI